MFLKRSLLLTVAFLLLASYGRAADLPTAAALEQLGLELHWYSQSVMNVQRDKITHISNDEENIYVQSSAGVLTVFHAENGQKRWVAQVGLTDETSMHAVSNSDTVLILAGPVAHAYNKFDGTLLFSHRLPAQPSAAPAIDETSFFVPLVGGSLYAYSLNILEYKNRYSSLPETVATAHLWRFICNEEIIYPPVAGELAVAFVTEDRNLHSVNATGLDRGRSRFQLLLKQPASAAPALVPNGTSYSVIVPTADNQIFSVDLVRGTIEWTYPMGRRINEAPLVVNDDVLIITEDGTLTKISRKIPRTAYYGRPVEIPAYASPAYIGTSLQNAEIDPDTQNALRLLSPQCVQVREVFPDGAAYATGIQAGDRIINIDNRPAASVEVAESQLAELPLRVERPIEVIRVSLGAVMTDVKLQSPVNVGNGKSLAHGVRLDEVFRNSPADAAGLQAEDTIISIDDQPVSSADEIRMLLTAAAPGKVTVKGVRGHDGIRATVSLAFVADQEGRATDASAISVHRMRLRVPIRKWDVSGIGSLTAVGRFAIYGIDVTNRLVAFGMKTARMLGRISVPGYRVHHHNSATDFIYLASDSGEIVCLREIGTTVTVPDLSASTRTAVVSEVAVKRGDGVDPGGVLLCQLETPDGETIDITVSVKGVVDYVFVRKGHLVQVGDPLFRIAEDNFAVYHQNPDKRPVDVDPASPDAAPDSLQ